MKTRILHAEDDDAVRAFLGQALRRFGYDVVSAADGEAALHRAENEHFDVVITDHHMPGKDGLALVAGLRAARFGGRIFVLSGALPEAALPEYLRLGVDGIAAKPISLAALRALLGDEPAEPAPLPVWGAACAQASGLTIM